ncbi:hypothetical protein PROFUN_02703 [Planoprotostelium fungivorum]|uniref:Rap-GAP domain-containing protein n=1 Tax=Planoprotostelium fungivorum TaxID=1890364 RepID=A0A2P6NVK6_9EUKA|nr:hypothetical protein PROFUN_02703 [Planoprotostelium fungivorum]
MCPYLYRISESTDINAFSNWGSVDVKNILILCWHPWVMSAVRGNFMRPGSPISGQRESEAKENQFNLKDAPVKKGSSVITKLIAQGRKEGGVHIADKTSTMFSRFLKKSRYIVLDPFNEYMNVYKGSDKKIFKIHIRLKDTIVEESGSHISLKCNSLVYFLYFSGDSDKIAWFSAITAAQRFQYSFEQFFVEIMTAPVTDEKIGLRDSVRKANFSRSSQPTSGSPLLNSPSAMSPQRQQSGMDVSSVPQEEGSCLDAAKDALRTTILDVNGKPMEFHHIVDTNAPTLILLLRHFGCLISRETISTVLRRQSDFDTSGISMVVVAPGDHNMARDFARDTKFQGKVGVDPEGKLSYVLKHSEGRYNITPLRKKKSLFERMKGKGIVLSDMDDTCGGIYMLSPKKGVVFSSTERYVGETMNYEYLLAMCRDYNSIHLQENWSSIQPPLMIWENVRAPLEQTNDMVTNVDGWNVEMGKDKLVYSSVTDNLLENISFDTSQYTEFFLGRNHAIFIGDMDGPMMMTGEESMRKASTNPILLMIKPSVKGCNTLALMWTKRGVNRYLISSPAPMSNSDVIRQIKSRTKNTGNLKLYRCKEGLMEKSISAVEQRTNNEHNIYCFGVVRYEKGQTLSEALENRSSHSFERFVGLLGSNRTLPKWMQTSHQKGSTLYSCLSPHFVIFEVMPWSSEENRGSYPIMLVYNESEEPIDPNLFDTAHIVIVIRPFLHKYQISVCSRHGINPFGPFIPNSPDFGEFSPEFHEFLLYKLVNATRSLDLSINSEHMEADRAEEILDLCALGYPSIANRDVFKNNVVEGMRNYNRNTLTLRAYNETTEGTLRIPKVVSSEPYQQPPASSTVRDSQKLSKTTVSETSLSAGATRRKLRAASISIEVGEDTPHPLNHPQTPGPELYKAESTPSVQTVASRRRTLGKLSSAFWLGASSSSPQKEV